MDFTVIQNAATKIVDKFNSVDTDITGLKSRATTLEQDVAVLDGRVDTFTSLPEGATTNDAALADIAVGYDGTVYPDGPGSAVRAQISQLNSEIAEMQDIIYYKELDMGEILVDTWISSTGSVASHAGNNLTDFIPVEVGQKILIDGTVTRLCYYNTNKTSLASALGTPTSLDHPIIEVPSNTETNQPKYIRFCYKVEGNENINCYLVDDVVMNGKNFVFPEKSIDWSALKDAPIEKKCNIASYWGSGSYPALSIYLKNKNSGNSIRLRLCHYTNDGENGYDLWQMRGAQPIIDGVEQSTIIANGSAWECAIKESGKADFVGCYPHGNQYADSIKVVVDGLETDITAINNMPFHTLDFYMVATLYSYGTNKGTELGKHYIHYTFADGCVEIEQKVIFSTDATLGLSYMAMLPSAKEYSEQQNIDGKWFLTATETSPRASGGMVGETLHNGIKSRMEVLSDNSDGFDEHIYSETDKAQYNKIYKTFYQNGKEVHNNSVMKSKTRYTFTF